MISPKARNMSVGVSCFVRSVYCHGPQTTTHQTPNAKHQNTKYHSLALQHLLPYSPKRRRREFQDVPCRITKINALAPLGPLDCPVDRYTALLEPVLPRGQFRFAYREGHVPRPERSMRRKMICRLATGQRIEQQQ